MAGCAAMPDGWLFFRMDNYFIIEFAANFSVFNPQKTCSPRLDFGCQQRLFSELAGPPTRHGSCPKIATAAERPDAATSSTVNLAPRGERKPDYVAKLEGTHPRYLVVEVAVSRSAVAIDRDTAISRKVEQCVQKLKDSRSPTKCGKSLKGPQPPCDLAMAHLFSIAPPVPPTPTAESFGAATCLVPYTEADQSFFESGPIVKMMKRE